MNMQLDKRQVRRQFDRSARTYDSVASMQRQIVDQLLPSKFAQDCASLLDAGCGTGYALNKLSKLAPAAKLSGLDLAPRMLELAKEGCPSANFTVGDIESLPFMDASHDVILSSSAIQWCDAKRVVNEFSRCLASGGELLLSTFTQGTLQDWRSLWGRSNQQRFSTLSELSDIFKDDSWQNVRIWSKEYVQTFATFSEAVASIRDLGAGDASSQRAATPMTRIQLARITEKANNIIVQKGGIELRYQVAFITANKR